MPLTGPHFTQPPTALEARAVAQAVMRQIQPGSMQFQVFSLCLLLISVALCLHAGLPRRPDLLPLLALTGLGLSAAIYLAAPGRGQFAFNCSGFMHGVFTALAFRFLADALPNWNFWVLPLCLLLTFTAAIVYTGFWRHLGYNLICWAILTRMGSVDSGEQGQAPLLILLMVIGIGLASSVCFFIDHSRRTNALLTLRLERLANYDALTGMRNRRSFLEAVGSAIAAAAPGDADGGSSAGRIHFALLDIDDFKRINDTLGHGAGDLALQRVASAIMAQCGARPCGRMGGEEFGILLAGMVTAEAETFLDGLVAAVRDSGQDGTATTASIGIATLQGSETLSEFLRRADDALYDAKRAGKNRWCAAHWPPAPACPSGPPVSGKTGRAAAQSPSSTTWFHGTPPSVP
ncbi:MULTISPECIES: sensor domain-containing diguanylate cyclase [Comamonadaceae]|uniref:GGDEF domain-containing protein n=1 Tax=Acidovorax sacchari TaxID=3230736 RepID=UPI0034A4C098